MTVLWTSVNTLYRLPWILLRISYYIHGPWVDEINFCHFTCVTTHEWWALHAVIKWRFLTLMFAVFLSNYVICILALVRGHWLSRLTELYVSASVLCRHAKFYPNKTTRAKLSYRSLKRQQWSRRFSYYDSSMCKPSFKEISESTADVHSYFRFCCATLEFHFRFWFWPHCISLLNCIVINDRGGVMTSYRFFKVAVIK